MSTLDDDDCDGEGSPECRDLDKAYHHAHHHQQQEEDNNTHTTAGWSSSGSISSFGGDEEDFQDDSSAQEVYYAFNSEEEANVDHQHQHLVSPKTLPGPSGAFKVICLSFLEPDISTCVASTVTEEALRLLQSGGLLYVVDGHGMVPQLPALRQLLKRISDEPPVTLKVHDIETREILQNHGFAAPTSDPKFTRWIGTKP